MMIKRLFFRVVVMLTALPSVVLSVSSASAKDLNSHSMFLRTRDTEKSVSINLTKERGGSTYGRGGSSEQAPWGDPYTGNGTSSDQR